MDSGQSPKKHPGQMKTDPLGQPQTRKPLLDLDEISDGENEERDFVIDGQIEHIDSPAKEVSLTHLSVTIEEPTKNVDSPNRGGSPVITKPMKLFSALFYGVSSFAIIVVNKIVLTSYSYPSYTTLGVGQMIATILVLGIAREAKIIQFQRFSLLTLRKIWLLSFFYIGNLIAGLGGTKHLPLPMFIALRRFSIALTAIGEFYLLNVKQSMQIIYTIVAMIGGSLIAAFADLSFNALGYILVMANNVFTAGNVVYTKKVLSNRSLDKYELLYYNAVLMLIPMLMISYLSGDLKKSYNYEHWTDTGFLTSFLLSCLMGFILMYSTVLCTHYNSALTTTVVGTLKNILSTYIGMYIGGDYQFTVVNFIGLNISLVGSLVYSYLTFIQKKTVNHPKGRRSVVV